MKQPFTFEHQQDLNRIRDAAMGVACAGLTTEELKRLNPNLLKSAPALYEALKSVMRMGTIVDSYERNKALEALAKAEK